MQLKTNVSACAVAALFAPTLAFATNGMNMEGYGPVATGMGGASMAYDNGNAAMMNNPATLAMMPSGSSRLDIAIGGLHPSIKANAGGASAKSESTAFYMPAFGYARKDGKLAYGVGMFAQGGMGAEYAANSWMSDGTDKPRSEVGVGRLIFPLAYEVNPNLNVGGSIDYVWATMDVKMYMNPPGMWAKFSDNNKYSGAAKGDGFAFKLGATYKLDSKLTVGAAYHSKTNLSDLKTNAAGAQVGGVTGQMTVIDFQWPETYGVGLAYQVTPETMVAADIKQVLWSNVMEKFKMNHPGLGGTYVMDQNWKDQTIFMLGASHKYNNALTVRAGVNIANNPVPDSTLNYLFPATITKHLTLGLGYAIDKVSEVNFSYTHGFKASNTRPGAFSLEHSQNNWQLMYSHRF